MDIDTLLSDSALYAWAVRFAALASCTLWVYDYILTVDSEIRLVWPARRSLVKVLFLANRYLPLIVTFNYAYFLILNSNRKSHLCRPAFIAIGYTSFSGFVLSESVLALRVYVVWEARTSIGVLVGVVFLAKTIAAGIITYIFLDSTMISPINILKAGCEIISIKRIEWVVMLLVFCFEVFILILMVMAKRAHLRKLYSELVDVLVQDGISYCICIMIISLANVMIVRFSPSEMSPFLVIMQGTLHSILCTRLLLRLRSTHTDRQSMLLENNSVPLIVTITASRTVEER